MFLSVFDIFKVGIGPSSSHTMGPMTAASRFLDALRVRSADTPDKPRAVRLHCSLHGSLAFTGKGHATDRAVILGLLGFVPETLDPDAAEELERQAREQQEVRPDELGVLAFDPAVDLVFDSTAALPGHPNGLKFKALAANGDICLEEVYYSIGGGFVVTAHELAGGGGVLGDDEKMVRTYPYGFSNAVQMLELGKDAQKTIAQMKRANELVQMDAQTLAARLDFIVSVMNDCVDRGLRNDGILPGGLFVKRRAKGIYAALLAEQGQNLNQPHVVNDWLCVYAMAVNEENAAGGRVVTSPTNGAAGVVPAVLRYYRDHCIGATHDGVRTLLLTAAAIGGLIKHNASISGAEVGCQGEVGSASAMAAAGLCASLGGSNEQIENAAEIALEHHLGMTCDPAKGLVQVPCIERNGLGAIKAVSAASLALRGDGTHFMPLDNCIETMRQTGLDMSDRYKETATGGLAVNLPEC